MFGENIMKFFQKLFPARRGKVILKRKQQRRNLPKPQPRMPSPTQTIATYLLNDFSTPELAEKIQLPVSPQLPPFSVDGYKGFIQNNNQRVATNAFLTVDFVLQKVNSIQPPGRWAATSSLQVHPLAGKDLNAYYDRKHLRFFYDIDRRTRSTIYLADSADVVAHELGHAILDCFRPEFFDAVALEIWGFHEAFADTVSILYILGHKEIRDYILSTVNGNLRISNVASRIGEQLSRALYPTGAPPEALRDAVNSFKYVDPKNLPTDGPDDQLSAEPHSFSRVMSGAIYDVLVGIYEKNRKNMDYETALVTAVDQMWKNILLTIKSAPSSVNFYKNFALTMIITDRTLKFGNEDVIRNAFTARGIISEGVTALARKKEKLTGEQINQFMVVKKQGIKPMQLAAGNEVKALNFNPLFAVAADVPRDEQFILDKDGYVEHRVCPTEMEIKDDLRHCLNLISSKGEVSESPKTMFEVKDNKLVRTHFRIND